jgi:Zn-dependent peptidase ImmA (M78 family)
MHRHGDPKGNRSSEREADHFASVFLMPERDLRARLSRRMTVDNIITVKQRWRISAMALSHRMNALGLLSTWQYKSACIELGKRGYRSFEPIGIERETSVVWRKILSQLWAEKITKNDIANDLRLPLDELEGLIRNLAGRTQAPTPTQGRREPKAV